MINKYAGKCSCNTWVEAGRGEALRVNERWIVRCAACLVTADSAPTSPVRAPFEYAPSKQVTAYHATVALPESYVLLSGHPASEHQVALFEHFAFGHGSVIIQAVAGSGKTTSMKNALRYLPAQTSVQMLAFNYAAGEQLKEAIRDLQALGEKDYSMMRAGTFHSVGMGAVLRHLGLPKAQISVDAGKCRNILKAKLGVGNAYNDTANNSAGKVIYDMYASFVLELVSKAKGIGLGALVPDTDSAWWGIISHHGLSLTSEEANTHTAISMARELLADSNKAAKEGALDFDDQLYLVVLWKLRLFRNDIVIADECQDTNPVRRAMLHLLLRDGGKLYAVGDEKQCHPAGTKVFVSGRGYVPIEQIREGNQVITYANGFFPGKINQGRRVEQVANHEFSGELIKITANEYEHEVTPNHKCHVRLADRKGSIVYVMWNGRHARVGRCAAQYYGGHGLATRANQEKAQNAWIIKFFDEGDEDSARLLESLLAYKYRLPQICFEYNVELGGARGLDVRARFWQEFPNNFTDMLNCLIQYKLDFELPFWATGDQKHVGGKYAFIIPAINLFDGWFNVCLFNGDPHKPVWSTATISRRKFDGTVYSLKVEPNEAGRRLYIANGIVTHNSIYAFTGADNDAMQRIQQEFNCKTLPLTVSYRCARKIVECAQTWVPYIEAWDLAEEGIVEDDVPLHVALATLTENDAILCRNTAPLVGVAYKLIASGRACRIAGKEIGEGLVNLIEQQKAKGLERLIVKLNAFRDREAAKFTAKGEETRAEAISDKVDCVLVIINALSELERSIPALVRKIQSMFVDVKADSPSLLTLSTQHKSKGKEWNRVAILQPELNPSKAARQQHEIDQEMNLCYVACTRAKTHLIYCAMGDTETEAPKKGAA